MTQEQAKLANIKNIMTRASIACTTDSMKDTDKLIKMNTALMLISEELGLTDGEEFRKVTVQVATAATLHERKM